MFSSRFCVNFIINLSGLFGVSMVYRLYSVIVIKSDYVVYLGICVK